MRFLVLAAVVVVVAGCGDKVKNPYFKPEISGATYAVPVATTGHKIPRIPLNMPNSCVYVQGEGWTCSGEIWDENGRLQMADDDVIYAAPKFTPVAQQAVPVIQATTPDSEPILIYRVGDPTADD